MMIRTAAFADIDPFILYGWLKLRADVFVVEQRCVYPDLDGRDTDPQTLHVWIDADGAVVGYLRVLAEPDGVARISRVVLDPDWRGKGLADELVATALAVVGDRPVRLSAQTGVEHLYGRHGFIVSGPEFIEDGIPHLPMTRG